LIEIENQKRLRESQKREVCSKAGKDEASITADTVHFLLGTVALKVF